MTGPFTIAIDGPAASGKGTIARALARTFQMAHLDTGLLYRGVGARMLKGDPPEDAAQALMSEDLDDPDLRSPEVSEAASKVATIPAVRAALLDFQRAFARRAGGAVLDGRDIGTVICPQAEVKIFVTANAEARAKRRFEELRGKGHDLTFADVLADIKMRDARDSGRAEAPLIAAPDATTLDTTTLDIVAATAAATELVRRRLG